MKFLFTPIDPKQSPALKAGGFDLPWRSASGSTL